MHYKIERTGQKIAKNNNGWTRLSTINSDFKGMKIELQKSRYCFDGLWFVMTVSSCAHAWLEPLRVLFIDIGLAPEDYLRAELIQSMLINPGKGSADRRLRLWHDIGKSHAMLCRRSKVSRLGIWFSLLDISQAYDIFVFISKTATSPSIDEAIGLKE